MEPLRDRNFRLLFSGRAISYFGTYLAPIAVAFAVLDLGGSATEVGLSFAAWTVAQVATLAFGGVIGDRFPRRIVMISSDVASTAVRTAMGVLLVTGHAHVWELIALQALGGASVAFYNPAFYGLVPEVVPADGLQHANSLLGIVWGFVFFNELRGAGWTRWAGVLGGALVEIGRASCRERVCLLV